MHILYAFFYTVVQASPFQSVFCGIFELLVHRVVLHPLHCFCMDEKFGLSSVLQWFNSSSFLHFSHRSGFHRTKDCLQADILNFVQFVGVHLRCCRPGNGPMFQRWSDCSHVDSFQNLGVGAPMCSRQLLVEVQEKECG